MIKIKSLIQRVNQSDHLLVQFLLVPQYIGATLPIHLDAELLSIVVVLCSINIVLLLSEVNQ